MPYPVGQWRAEIKCVSCRMAVPDKPAPFAESLAARRDSFL